MAHVEISNLSHFINAAAPDAKFYQKYKTVQKKIISSVDASFSPGLTAILGPSGCGKTTLIDALSGRKYANQIQFDTFNINGEAANLETLNRVCGYVAQDDLQIVFNQGSKFQNHDF